MIGAEGGEGLHGQWGDFIGKATSLKETCRVCSLDEAYALLSRIDVHEEDDPQEVLIDHFLSREGASESRELREG